MLPAPSSASSANQRRHLDSNRGEQNRLLWAQPHDLGQPDQVAAVLAPLGITPDAFMALVGDTEVKAAPSASTDEAVARGVFGAPTCFVGEAMFFGQHRLDFVRDALTTA